MFENCDSMMTFMGFLVPASSYSKIVEPSMGFTIFYAFTESQEENNIFPGLPFPFGLKYL